MRNHAKFAIFAAFMAALTGCGGAPPPKAPERAATAAEWREGRRLLEEKRAIVGVAPHTMKLSLTLREPRSGKVMQARGAVAIAPPSALRMVLVGPGGTTALDLWSKDGAFRFAVPALDLLRRGDASTPRAAMRGMPVDFLQWWLLRPFSGKILDFHREVGVSRYVLSDRDAKVELALHDDGRVEARRSTFTRAEPGAPPRRIDEETIEADSLGCGVVRYRQRSTALSLTVTCESDDRDHPPSPRAFLDPDEASP